MLTNDRICLICEAPIVRKRYPGGRIEPLKKFRDRRHCSHKCAMISVNQPKLDRNAAFANAFYSDGRGVKRLNTLAQLANRLRDKHRNQC
jgi:hypothetical protein